MSEASVMLLVDPSLILSPAGLSWLEDDESALSKVVISAAFAHWIIDEPTYDFSAFVSPAQAVEVPDLRRVRRVVERMTRFSATRDHPNLPEEASEVLRQLVELNDRSAEVLADEWAFLNSQSWMVSRSRNVLDAFRDAGGVVVECGHRLSEAFMSAAVGAQNIPDVLTAGFMVKVGAKWLVIGGSAASGALGSLLLGPGGAIGGAVGGTVASRVVAALDP